MTKMDLGWATLRCLCCGTDYGIVRILSFAPGRKPELRKGKDRESVELLVKPLFESANTNLSVFPIIEWIGDIGDQA